MTFSQFFVQTIRRLVILELSSFLPSPENSVSESLEALLSETIFLVVDIVLLMFLLHNFRPCLIKQMIFVPIKKRFPNICRVSKSKNRMNTTLERVSRLIPSVSSEKVF